MAEVVEVLEGAQPWVFAVIALSTLRRWWRLRDQASAVAAGMFGLLTGVSVVAQLLPDDPEDVALWEQQALLAVLLLFPYLLFRFATTFRRRSATLERTAALLTAAVCASIFLFDDLPAPGEPRSLALVLYTVLVVVQWGGLSALVTVWLWQGGAGKPTMVRRRMRLLAAGVAALALAVMLVAVRSGPEVTVLDLAAALIVLATGPLFLVGLAPPGILLARWRRPEEAAARQAEAGLVAATTPEEVASALLPHVARTVGARAAVLRDVEGVILGVHRTDGLAPTAVAGNGDSSSRSIVSVPMRSGELSVEGDAYTPFFGEEEISALERLAGLTDVALRRAALTGKERAAAAELEAANAAMRDFVAVASHDLRTPIAVVKGFASTMTASWDRISDRDKLDYLATITRQADHLSRLVTDLLTASQLDTGDVTGDPEAVPIADLVREVLSDLDRESGVACAVEGEPVAWADADHAARIVRNLVENAFAYGAPPVEVAVAVVGAEVELRVRDHGPGVADDLVPRLFDRFARGQEAKHGTGLGLSIVRGLARAGGGDAWYEEAGPGARFVVRWPRAEPTATAHDPELGTLSDTG